MVDFARHAGRAAGGTRARLAGNHVTARLTRVTAVLAGMPMMRIGILEDIGIPVPIMVGVTRYAGRATSDARTCRARELVIVH